MENIKVFELAKQMGMETIALMDKLREFKIPVKSHMAELDQVLIETIKAKFAEEKTKTVPKSIKTVRAKKAVSVAAPTPKVVKASQVGATTKAVIKAPAAVRTAPSAAAKTAPSRTVIRRKANVQDATPAAAGTESGVEAETFFPREARILEMPNRGETSARPSQRESGHASTETAATGARHQTDLAAEQASAPRAPTASDKGAARGVTAQVISRIDLRETMGDRAMPAPAARPGTASAAASATSVKPDEDPSKFDREAIGKLIKQEALAQARKAAALQRETKVETFNAAEFKKREMLLQPKKKKTLVGRAAQKTQITTPSKQKRKIKVEGGITVSGLAQAMGIKATDIIKKLVALGTMAKMNDMLDLETAQVMATEYNYEIENVALTDEQLIAQTSMTEGGELVLRPPVVTVMGHVDHGKTSLLDAIRKTEVAAGEAGGITQHIGAYSVLVNGKKITFLDTPGHEAFTAMRARGAKVTDIVVLVVAADDGIMPQTREAITHAKSAGVPIIVAVNKMDLPNANPQRVLQGLTEFELVPEEWGGTTIVAKVSAAKKDGIKELLEMILLQAEVLELKADPKRPANGTVIEAKLERGRGPVATLLMQQGTARVGEELVAGTAMGRIRAMMNDKGQQIKEAGPGDPVEVLGLNSVPNAGDTFDVVKDEEVAKEVVEKRVERNRVLNSAGPLKMSLEDLFAKVQSQDIKELPVVVKADVQGSAEALKEMLNKLPSDQVRVKVLSSSVGGISESDVLLASASQAIIIGFNVRPETGVNAVAQREGVEIKTYSIIYDVVDDIKKAMTGMLAPQFVEKAMGRAEIRSLFNVPKVGTIAGCFVVDGRITRQALVRLLRDSRVVYEGKLSSLKRFKDDVREVQNGYECGIGIENYNDLKVGDVLEAYMKEQVTALLN